MCGFTREETERTLSTVTLSEYTTEKGTAFHDTGVGGFWDSAQAHSRTQ